MRKYIIRLDDACEKRDIEKWNRMELLLDKYSIKPLVGIIPHCEDEMMNKYNLDADFWNLVSLWILKNWSIAMHGYNHVYITECGGLNPVNKRSEFAGVPLLIQQEKIRDGVKILKSHGINPTIFIAPSHTFDENTLEALRLESEINIISDTIANSPYYEKGFYFVPQQSGKVRNLPFNWITFCYHPNFMQERDFEELELFIQKQKKKFIPFPQKIKFRRKKSVYDKILNKLYFSRKR